MTQPTEDRRPTTPPVAPRQTPVDDDRHHDDDDRHHDAQRREDGHVVEPTAAERIVAAYPDPLEARQAMDHLETVGFQHGDVHLDDDGDRLLLVDGDRQEDEAADTVALFSGGLTTRSQTRGALVGTVLGGTLGFVASIRAGSSRSTSTCGCASCRGPPSASSPGRPSASSTAGPASPSAGASTPPPRWAPRSAPTSTPTPRPPWPVRSCPSRLAAGPTPAPPRAASRRIPPADDPPRRRPRADGTPPGRRADPGRCHPADARATADPGRTDRAAPIARTAAGPGAAPLDRVDPAARPSTSDRHE